ncbi:hypothetical protein [Desulfothermus sp.]
MQYDIASKVILSHCRKAVLQELCGLRVKDAELIEVRPQETASVRRSDFVLKALFEDGTEKMVLLELITAWKKYLPLRTLETRCRHLLEEGLEIETIMIELRRCYGVKDYYHDNEVDFRYKLVKLYEMEAKEVLRKGVKCLYPFVPLMKGGSELVEEAERGIYEGEESRAYKADMLTGMTIMAGLVSEEMALKLLQRRRDIMIESAAYELIGQERYEAGMQQGLLLEAQEMLVNALEERFEIVPRTIVRKIKEIKDREVIKGLFRVALRSNSLEEFESKLKRAME